MVRAGAAVVVNDLGGSISGAGGGDLSPAQEVVGEIKRLGGRAVADCHSVADWNGAIPGGRRKPSLNACSRCSKRISIR